MIKAIIIGIIVLLVLAIVVVIVLTAAINVLYKIELKELDDEYN
jgi:hypothetical protein